MPIKRQAQFADTETRYPISAWKHSVYEVAEADGHLRLDLTGDTPRLFIHLEDDQICTTPIDMNALVAKRNNPPCDLLKIMVDTSEGTRTFILEPGEADGQLIEIVSPKSTPRIWQDQWRISSRQKDSMLLDIELPTINPEAIEGLQVEIADNDMTFHTQWRRLAPQGKMIQIVPSGP